MLNRIIGSVLLFYGVLIILTFCYGFLFGYKGAGGLMRYMGW